MVSIIVPTYNVAPYITKCLHSVASQTYRGAMECLVVDDCGTDDSIAIAEKFISEYTGDIQFRIVHHDRNRGLSAARNTGTSHASGEYLYFLDSDDWLTEDCIERMMECVEKHPGVELVIGSAYDVFPDVTLTPAWYNPDPKSVPEFTDDRNVIRRLNLNFSSLPVTAWNKLVKRSAVLEHDIYFVEGLLNEDVMFDCLLGKHIKTMAVCFTPTYYYLRRSDSLNTPEHVIKSDKSFLTTAGLILDNIDEACRKELILVALKISHQRYVKGKNTEVRQEAKRLLWRIWRMSGVKIKSGILLLFLLPAKLNNRERIFRNLFMYKIFGVGELYKI